MTVVDGNGNTNKLKKYERAIVASNKYQEFKKESEEIWSKWKDTTWVKSIKEDRRKIASLILENERLYLEETSSQERCFKEIAYDLIARVINKLVIFDLVTIHPLLTKESELFGESFVWNGDSFTLAQNWYHANMSGKAVQVNSHNCTANDIERFASLIALEIDRDVIKDFSLCVGTWVNKTADPSTEEIKRLLAELHLEISQKTLKEGGKWVVLSAEITEILQAEGAFTGEQNLEGDIQDLGRLWGEYRAFSDKLLPQNTIITGIKRELSDYVYAPYIWIQQNAVVFRVEDFSPTRNILLRFAKKLISPKSYGIIKFRK